MSPAFNRPLPIFHNTPIPQVVIVANGGACDSHNPTTHFSATSMYTLHSDSRKHIHNVNTVQCINFCQKHIVGLLGSNSKIGHGIYCTIAEYSGSKNAHNHCDRYYQNNEKKYAFTLLHQVNKGLTQCKEQTDKLRQELQAIEARKDRLQARLARIADNSTPSIHAGMCNSHISNTTTHHTHIDTSYITHYNH